ncbi:MAG: lytic transglycosylase domain-containing protein [Ruminiclostridium sp.]|nr:lytic transglycosylase domain-containing protein [Ruminiclostridium sp.]
MRQKNKNRFKYILIFAVLLAVFVLMLDNTPRLMFPIKYREYVGAYSGKYNVDPFLVLAIIKVESKFDPDAVSPKNARGLMQISQKTGEWGAKVLKLKGYDFDSLFDPETNITIGCWYLKVLTEEFNGNTDLILAAYNGGSGNVKEWLNNRDYSSTGKSLDRVPFRETEKYIEKVGNYRSIYKMLYENIF